MKRRDLIRHLTDHGCELVREPLVVGECGPQRLPENVTEAAGENATSATA